MWARGISCSITVCLLGCGTATNTSEATATSDTSSGSDTGDSVGPVALDWVGEPEVITYPRQPMVVDINVELTTAANLQADFPSDPGVRVAIESVTATSYRLRVRGLRPDQAHEIQLSAEGTGGEQLGPKNIAFTTEPARPGFLQAFPVTRPDDGSTPDPSYRLFDLIAYVPGPAINGAYAVDRQGVTRWYLDAFGPAEGPGSLWAGLGLRDDGTIRFAVDGEVFIIDELGEVVHHATPEQLGQPVIHHDLIEMPSGHLLGIGASYREIDYGPDIGKLWVAGDTLVEFAFTGPTTTEVFWEWDIFDHLDPLRTRSGFEIEVEGPDPSTPARDWTHANGVVFNPEDNSLLLSLRHQDWILSIDRTTGDLNWKLGPDGDFELVEGTWFYHQHSPEWQADGTLLLYDNGLSNPDVADADEISRAARYELDFGAMTARRVWEDDGEPLMSALASDADRLPNGHILVLDSVMLTDINGTPTAPHSRLRELDEQRSPMEIWSIRTPAEKFAYRATAWQRLVGEAVTGE